MSVPNYFMDKRHWFKNIQINNNAYFFIILLFHYIHSFVLCDGTLVFVPSTVLFSFSLRFFFFFAFVCFIFSLFRLLVFASRSHILSNAYANVQFNILCRKQMQWIIFSSSFYSFFFLQILRAFQYKVWNWCNVDTVRTKLFSV